MSHDASVQRRGTLAGLVTCMRGMLTTGELSDFEFHIGRAFGEVKSFRVHKYVLSMRSPIFRAMFYGSMAKPGQNTEEIPDIHPEAFAKILSFMYTDKVDNLDANNAFATWVAADRYDLPLLVEMASNCVANTLDVSNCLHHLENTGLLVADCERLRKKCLELVDVHSDAVFRSKKFDTLPLPFLKLILERDTLSAEENVIYQAVELWARAACLRSDEDPSPAMRRAKLGDALQLVRFPLLTEFQLAEGPGMTGLLTEQELHHIRLCQRLANKSPAQFGTKPRLHRASRAGTRSFPDGKEVFVTLCADSVVWEAARVAQNNVSRGNLTVVLLARQPSGDAAVVHRPYQIVRAGDILQSGRELRANVGQEDAPVWVEAIYQCSRAGVHVVQHDNREYSVQFRDMTMRTGQVMARKAVLLG